MKPQETIERFDRFLAERQLEFSGVVVGGTALSLLGVISRETRDCDVIEPTLPDPLLAAAALFAAAERAMDHDLMVARARHESRLAGTCRHCPHRSRSEDP